LDKDKKGLGKPSLPPGLWTRYLALQHLGFVAVEENLGFFWNPKSIDLNFQNLTLN
jgi:hypothetical protein